MIGWSEFKTECEAKKFADYLEKDVINKWGLDGIDIDDEHSASNDPQEQSLAMVTTVLKKKMPSKLITKALWEDHGKFKAKWNDHTLAENLDYGWEMSYYSGTPKEMLSFYAENGMKKSTLCLGFSAEKRFAPCFPSIGPTMDTVMSEGYGGRMLFDYQNDPSLMKVIIKAEIEFGRCDESAQ